MKKILIAIILGFSLMLLQAQETKLDQTEPLNKKAGRVVKLKKVMTITDKQGGFYFRMPGKLSVSSDGSIFFMDMSQLLRFDKKGKLLNNYRKTGQGPGEFGMMASYVLNGETLIVLSKMPNKIIWFALDGRLIKEFRIKKFSFGKLLLFRDSKYYFFKHGIPFVKGKMKIIDVPYSIREFSDGDMAYKNLITFPVKKYVMSRGDERRSYSVGKFVAKVYKNRYLIVSHTPEYLIKIYDVAENRIIRVFSRKYSRVKSKKKKKTTDNLRPKLKYQNDIRDILSFQDKVWAITSTEDPKKGTLVDVFDHEGSYIDNFYIKFKGKVLGCDERGIFMMEENRKSDFIIVKYKVKL
ncbi:MAG: 6-bladed beta-propeller [Candidatus Aminicenantes bacterium]|nr:6-bladed beta-propeller [Candidatus Aminicenantes bacterium]